MNNEILYFTFGIIFSLGSVFKLRLLHVISMASFFMICVIFINKKQGFKQETIFSLVNINEILISCLIILIDHVFMRKKANKFYFFVEKISVFLLIFGLALSVYSFYYLSKLRIKEKELVFTGPYSFIRHPIYFGFFVFVIGCELYLSCYVSAFITLFFMYTKIRERITEEENKLCADEKYKNYKKKVSSGFFI
ncbi:S-isoprenylcysteine methyltransferase [Tubulinosema ratisbonensis]|uniref:Protein-S-isoprenylcysteine O-methyltransferase n=1 Tax=Tubulinosema ratisbonensis TaxID=291195 RepID=A0A437AQJ0_9MICR|nr:S-isoprenylcysteine methyltransferase [Tubulinosema ratisbonensis]